MTKNVVSFYSEGKGQGLQIPINGLMEGDVVDASLLASRELTFAFSSTLTGARSIKVKGKNLNIEVYKGSNRTTTAYLGDYDVATAYTIATNNDSVRITGSLTELQAIGIGIGSMDISAMPCLEILMVGNNRIHDFNASGNIGLKHLDIHDSGINLTTLNLDGCKSLEYLNCSNSSHLEAIRLKGCKKLITLFAFSCNLQTLDVTECVALEDLRVNNNHLKTLNVSKNVALTYLGCNRNQLISLDLSKNIVLTSLSCYDNQLTSLDLSKNIVLTNLSCYENQLISLDLSKNIVLTGLDCYENQLISLDLSKNVALTDLSCNSNHLTSLDLSKNVALTDLDCSNNQLSSLDVSKNVALTSLNCYRNQLTSLDLRNCKKLVEAYVEDNNLPLIYFAEGLEGANIRYASPTEESENNLDDLNAQIWALPEVESASLYIYDEEDVVFSQLDEEAIAQAESRGWQILNEDY